MQERPPCGEGNKSEWDIFAQENNALQKLQEKDPEGYDLIKSYFEIRQFQKSALYRAEDDKAKNMIVEFAEKVDAVIGNDEVRAEKLEPFFTEIRDL